MTSITRYDPLDDFFRGFFVRPVELGTPAEAPHVKVDVVEDADKYTVHAELPGINKDDIHVSIDGAMISISAERKSQKEVKEGDRILRSERYFGKVSRSFELGQDVDESRAAAKFSDGVLELSLPKKAVTSARRLEIS
ncbi:MAG TPA: heat-shock protein Hsp20 [Rhodocyclaceae bacterium]|nr:MAG: heat-shock protein Hsp20 [Betaproteobacteria bacterium CG2_30_68_42]PIV76961.1 MAG: heat-shock protein Hsp20 [Rhodocyclales bacterium CG17_big_fil_post_rev_8_21_14_2_50_68_7]PIX75066.1 MAG: heat-shock protein Hsp20 [Rhodocyclales bacterium CG_4_10_14_3_um_filter_68_10]PJA56695.1 MAG: heat-shock protein Hsp20 [Rhodocyclales bacterium CG_4_9_14_3_um_filter_68_10]HCX33961.1 heat-shock protein Hsp20 [Rhodocyclaceae bacterium]